MSAEPVLFAVDDGVATVTLNRPDAMNAMTPGFMQGIRDAFARVAGNEDIRVVVMTGAGRGFCAGADLQEVPESSSDTLEVFNGAIRDVAGAPVPTVARVNGPAAGGGLGLALACDITVACESAFFVAPFGPRLGIVPDMGATWNLPRRVGRARSLGMALLGDRVSAAQAAEWGMIWTCVPDDALDAEIERITGLLRNISPTTATRTRRAMDEALQTPLSEQLDVEMAHQRVLLPRHMLEGALAFREKRAPRFGGERE